MTLTAQQKELWDTQGYLAYDEPLLTPDEVEALGKRIAELAGGARPDLPPEVFSVERAVAAGTVTDVAAGDQYRVMRFLHKYDDLVLAACRTPTILDVVEDLLAPNIKLYTDQVFMKPPFHGGQQGWHQDSATWRFFASHDHVTCWVALDEATEENGCLRYLPGTHKCGYVDRDRVPVLVEQLQDTAVPVPRAPGYGVFHHALTLHSSGPNTTPNRRRGLVLHYVNAETRYIGLPGDRKGPFPLMRGQEFPGRI